MVMSLAYGFVLVWVGCFVGVFAGRVSGGLGIFNVLVAMFGMGISVFCTRCFWCLCDRLVVVLGFVWFSLH